MTGVSIDGTDSKVAAAITAEKVDAESVYPDYARTAEDEGFGEIATWLRSVARAERHHVERLERYLAEQRDGNEGSSDDSD